MSMGGDFQPPVVTNDAPQGSASDLATILDQADAIIWRDGGIDPMEEKIFGAWVMKQEMKIKGMQAQQMAAQGGAPGGAPGQQPFSPSQRVPSTNEEPYSMSGSPNPQQEE